MFHVKQFNIQTLNKKSYRYVILYIMILKQTDNMNAVQLAALATTLLPQINITEVKEIEGSDKDYRYILLKDKENQNYVLTTPKKEKYTNKFIADIYNTKILKDKYIVPEIVANNDKIAIFKTYQGASYDITIINTTQIKNLAKTLAKLHTLNYHIVEQNKIPSWTNEQLIKNLFDVLDEAKNTGKIPAKLIEKFEILLETNNIWKFNQSIINGNINDRSIIFKENNVVNILNWSALQYSDPAIDLCFILPRISKDNKQIFLKEYNKNVKKLNQHSMIDNNISERAEFYADFKYISDYLIAKANNNTVQEEETLKKIKKLEKQNILNEELNKVEEDLQTKQEDQQIKELESKINDEQKTEMLNLTASEQGTLRTTSDKIIDTNIDSNSEVEKELLEMLNNESGEINLRTQPSINTNETPKVSKKEFSISEHTGEIKEKDD